MKLLFITITTLISYSVAFPEAYRNVRIQRADTTPSSDVVELGSVVDGNLQQVELSDTSAIDKSIGSSKKLTEGVAIDDEDSKTGDDLDRAAFGWGGYGGYGGWGGFGGYGGWGGYGGFGGWGRPWGWGGGFW